MAIASATQNAAAGAFTLGKCLLYKRETVYTSNVLFWVMDTWNYFCYISLNSKLEQNSFWETIRGSSCFIIIMHRQMLKKIYLHNVNKFFSWK